MNTEHIYTLYQQHPHTQSAADALRGNVSCLHLKGLMASSAALFLLSVYKRVGGNVIVVLPEREDAAYFYSDLVRYLGEEDVLLYPSSYRRLGQTEHTDATAVILRTEVLNRICQPDAKCITVTYPEALCENVISLQNLRDNTLQLSVGEKLSIDFIVEVLMQYHFERVDFVYEPGQYAVRGSIVDVFSFAHEKPYRIDFFGDEVESIRTFDVVTQLSASQYKRISILPNVQNSEVAGNYVPFFDFLPSKPVVWAKDLKLGLGMLDNQLNKMPATDTMEQFFSTGEKLSVSISRLSLVEWGNASQFLVRKATSFDFQVEPQVDYKKNFVLLSQKLNELIAKDYTVYLLSDSAKQIERLQAIFHSSDVPRLDFIPIQTVVHEGFTDHNLKMCVYTDHQVFQRYHKYSVRSGTEMTERARDTFTLREITNLNPGDYVVHTDHGIGRFGGLEKIEVNGKQQETIRLIYQDNDVLFVSIHSLHRISKYKGKDGEVPSMHKLGSGAWQKLKQKTKSRVKDIAKELIALYARRKEAKGFSFAPDSYLQHALESSFIYEDTPDQIKATADVKRDMEAAMPMDRLVCGDVGFGKTEVAIRAAFKAVTDSKQVAVLVPTTILAWQHYKTFGERLKDFPCRVDYVSRMKSTKDIKNTLDDLANGKIDVIIGTHRLLSNDIKFKDLGLLVVDEEQKFGVAMKDKLKQLKLNVDTLTLTATPIPRTMQFSLMGARDLSIIRTPPPNRYPINTELHTFETNIIRDAIRYEVARGGQVFFIHNRVQNIAEVQDLIARICPEVRTCIGHGQMDGDTLEKVMLDFISQEYDVLIATTIIESGLDIPNANTIIINNAHNFGLSDLHQLRGRVGRSNKKAFCYLLAPPISVLTPEARQRLKAIESFAELGSGFNIALQDLDIRGAGNMLGGEQSGFIADIGFETYQRILDEALLELKETEFKDLYNKPEESEAENKNADAPQHQRPTPDDVRYVNDCQIDTDLELLFPDWYIENIAERINLYRELDNIANEEQLQRFERDLRDRFGALPEPSVALMHVVRLRWQAIQMGIEKLLLKNGQMICYFVSNEASPFYQSRIFGNILSYVQHRPRRCQLKQSPQKLSLVTLNVKSIQAAQAALDELKTGVKPDTATKPTR